MNIIPKIMNKNYIKYLLLEFEGNLILDTDSNKKIDDKIKEEISKKEGIPLEELYLYKGYDFNNKIPKHSMCNILLKLFGLPTLPTNKNRRKRICPNMPDIPKFIEEIVETAYINYEHQYDKTFFNKQVLASDGEWYCILNRKPYKGKKIQISNVTHFKSVKNAFNANRNDIFDIIFRDGQDVGVAGWWNWSVLKKNLSKNIETYNVLISFLNDLLDSKDVTKEYTFYQLTKQIDINKKDFQEKIDNFVPEFRKKYFKTFKHLNKWMYIIFGDGNGITKIKKFSDCSNLPCDESGEHPEVYARIERGINLIKETAYGKILLKLDNPFYETLLRRNPGFSTCLESGYCRIIGLTKYNPIPNYKNDWNKISE